MYTPNFVELVWAEKRTRESALGLLALLWGWANMPRPTEPNGIVKIVAPPEARPVPASSLSALMREDVSISKNFCLGTSSIGAFCNLHIADGSIVPLATACNTMSPVS
jgi:hypothetical protein